MQINERQPKTPLNRKTKATGANEFSSSLIVESLEMNKLKLMLEKFNKLNCTTLIMVTI